MKNYEQIIKQLIETSPSWEKDGGGVRGRTIAPIVSDLSSSRGMADFVPQQFNQSNNETIQRSAQDPVADLILGGGGGGSTCSSLGLYFKTNENDNTTLWISQGWANGHIDAQEVASSGSGFVVAETTIDKSTGEDIGTIITTKQSPITDTDTKFYFIIGSYNFGGSGGTAGGSGPTVSQFHCGSIWGYSCRIDYSSPPSFSFRYYS